MRNKRRNRLTVEKLGADCLDVRALYRAGIFKDYGFPCGGPASRECALPAICSN